MENKYIIIGYQLIYEDGQRDTVKLQIPIKVENLEMYRNIVKSKYKCKQVNLNYVEELV